MALKLGSLFYDIGADTSDLKRAEREVDRTNKRMGKSFSRLGGVIAAAFSIEAARRIINVADSMTRLEGRIKVITRTEKEFNDALEGTFRIANDIGVAVDGTIQSFQRFSLVRDVVNASNDDILDFTETIQKLGIISGATGEEVRATSIQIGQALTNNFTSAAQEINSINEQMPLVARTIETQLSLGFGTFKKEAIAGRITAKMFFDAIIESQKEVDNRFKELPETVDRAVARMGNSLKIAANDINKELEFTPFLVRMMNGFSNAIKSGARETVFAIKRLKIDLDALVDSMKANFELGFKEAFDNMTLNSKKAGLNIRLVFTKALDSIIGATNRTALAVDSFFNRFRVLPVTTDQFARLTEEIGDLEKALADLGEMVLKRDCRRACSPLN